jgi:hypothetical protein
MNLPPIEDVAHCGQQRRKEWPMERVGWWEIYRMNRERLGNGVDICRHHIISKNKICKGNSTILQRGCGE